MLQSNSDLSSIYDKIYRGYFTDGIDLTHFYSNPSYFNLSVRDAPTLHKGGHPTVIHWPIDNYEGGTALKSRLSLIAQDMAQIVDANKIKFIDENSWHSTVYSPIHSSAEEAAEKVPANCTALVAKEVKQTKPYTLRFDRVLVTSDGGVFAVALASNDELYRLRERLTNVLPNGFPSKIIHITLARVIEDLSDTELKELGEYISQMHNEDVPLGELTISFITYGWYQAPITEMRIESISTIPFDA